KQYFWHRFYSHQPDLNYDNPAVHDAIFRVMDYWFRMGVDGMRLDAIPYLFEREHTNCENLPETHGFLKKLRAHLDHTFENRMLLAEANQWPEETVPYFGDGDECHMNFHFPVMPRLFMSIQMEDRFPIIDILRQTPAIPENCQWATFLRNHDELTLEMVTDEERDYMYRVYAHDPKARINLGIRRRLGPLLGNNRRKIELMNALLFSLPGTPVLYYGDEIGMGDNIYLGDRNGVRTPMQWSPDRNAGFSRVNPQRLYLPIIVDPEYHYETVNVEAQQSNPSSLLWWTKRLIALRKRFKAFGRGTIEFLYPDNRKVLAFVRRYENECMLVVANLSRFSQYVQLDLSHVRGSIPVELFGRSEFPPVGTEPYVLTLGPHGFYWFSLLSPRVETAVPLSSELPTLALPTGLAGAIDAPDTSGLLPVLSGHMQAQRWFQGKARKMRAVTIEDRVSLPLPDRDEAAEFAFVHVDYIDHDADDYIVPLALAQGATDALRRASLATVQDEPGRVVDALVLHPTHEVLLDMVINRRKVRGRHGDLQGIRFPALRTLLADRRPPLESRHFSGEQTNSSIAYGEHFVLKVFRRLEVGESLDLEIGRFLSERAFPNAPRVAGAIEYRRRDAARTVAVLQEFVPNEGDAWALTLDAVAEAFERAATGEHAAPPDQFVTTASLLAAASKADATDVARQSAGTALEHARLLGQRTAEMHLVLGSEPDDQDFAPEPFTMFYQRSLYQSMRNLAGRTFQLLGAQLDALPSAARADANAISGLEERLLTKFRRIIDGKLHGQRIRTHGDYHLGQVLFTGRDFVITDFEGEPARPLGERRIKRSPLRDVAGMLRSYHYAAYSSVIEGSDGHGSAHERASRMPWAEAWYGAVATEFLHQYLVTMGGSALLPPTGPEIEILLDAYLLEKAVYELAYEMNNRPGWAAIPLLALRQLLQR
ncbi:MAG: putative maltokinase, partial [Longimicrobiales bacterium]